MTSADAYLATTPGVVFIDSNVPDIQDLINGLAPGEQAFVLSPTGDGLDQIADILAANNLANLASISIVSHGASGDTTWSLVEIGGFNGDGKSDALWRQSTTGALSEWLMNGSQITSASTVTSQSVNPMPDASWQVLSKPTNFA
jgi:Domain of unknown function (DUF4347)